MEVFLRYAEPMGAAASVAMALIWLIYLQLFFLDYRNRRRPRLIIQQADAPHPSQYCRLVNMSTMHMDVVCVLVVAHLEEGEKVRPLRQADHEANGRPDEVRKKEARNLKDGPLAPGESLLLGSFQELAEWVVDLSAAKERDRPHALEIRALFIHGMWNEPNGSCRTFELKYADSHLQAVKPVAFHTAHFTKKRQRRQLQRWYEQTLDDS